MIFEFRQYQLEYLIIGNGPEPLLGFHGFGQIPAVFYNIEPSLGRHFTLYSFALFHHGKSRYPAEVSPDKPIEPEFLAAMLDAFCAEKKIEQVSLLGYSLGGRVCLQYLQLRPERIKAMILLAPDGIKKSFWYHFATQSPRGKKLFKRMIDRPSLFFQLVKYFRMMGIVSKKMEKFIHSQYDDETNRKKIFNVWNAYSHITPRVSATRQAISEYRIPAVIFTGTYDPVLNEEIGRILSKGLEEYVHWQPIKAGHDLIKESYNEVIYPVIAKKIFHHL